MAHPLRIQRKRTKGFRLPHGTVVVTRPTKWGNPFEGPDAVEAFRAALSGELWSAECDANACGEYCSGDCNCTCGNVLYFIEKRRLNVRQTETGRQRQNESGHTILVMPDEHIGQIRREIGELRGKQLACYCGLDKPCHADVLCELANA